MAKTSNPSSSELQDRILEDRFEGKEGLRVYELVSHLIESWGSDDIGEHGYSSIGVVVGATFPDQAKKIRAILPNAYFLVPGYGAQGATAKDLAACFNDDGLGALINSSRGITYAYAEKGSGFEEGEYGKAARAAVEKMKKDLESIA